MPTAVALVPDATDPSPMAVEWKFDATALAPTAVENVPLAVDNCPSAVDEVPDAKEFLADRCSIRAARS